MGIIRPTVEKDLDFLVNVFETEPLILEGFPMSDSKEIVDSCKYWLEMALKGMGLTYEIEGKIAGMIVLYIPFYKKFAHTSLFSIVVSQEFRRQNIGSSLIEAILKLGKSKYDLKVLHLEVYEKNFAAIALYKKLGFKQYGIQEHFIKTQNGYFAKILMEKRLTES